MKELQTNGLTLEQELERYKSWLEDLHIRYNELDVKYKETEKAYEQLKRDVKRYFELDNRYLLHPESNELYHLKKTLKGR